MIALIIKSYLGLLITIVVGAVTVFSLGLYFIFKKRLPSVVLTPVKAPVLQPASTHDIHAIAGDDVIATQLDLARAYLEAGSLQLAKNILEQVILQGSDTQQQEARQLLGAC